MNLKILFMKWYQIHNFSFFVKSYASVRLPKMQKFIKKKKTISHSTFEPEKFPPSLGLKKL